MWKVQRQRIRCGPWKTLFYGPELGARQCYRDVFQRRARCNLVLIDPAGLPVLWSPKPVQTQGGKYRWE